jgi:hypothetical protein
LAKEGIFIVETNLDLETQQKAETSLRIQLTPAVPATASLKGQLSPSTPAPEQFALWSVAQITKKVNLIALLRQSANLVRLSKFLPTPQRWNKVTRRENFIPAPR